MKKLMVMALFVFGGLLYAGQAHAQVSFNISIGDQPAWAPEGADDAQYYYIPDMDVYYDVYHHQFLYLQDRRWIRTSVLPSQYRRFDLYKIHKVPVNTPNAYRNHKSDKVKYSQYRGKYDQTSLRDSHDDKYKNNRDNWHNNQFKNSHGDDGNHKKNDHKDHH
jgi:hypothetical protein